MTARRGVFSLSGGAGNLKPGLGQWFSGGQEKVRGSSDQGGHILPLLDLCSPLQWGVVKENVS